MRLGRMRIACSKVPSGHFVVGDSGIGGCIAQGHVGQHYWDSGATVVAFVGDFAVFASVCAAVAAVARIIAVFTLVLVADLTVSLICAMATRGRIAHAAK